MDKWKKNKRFETRSLYTSGAAIAAGFNANSYENLVLPPGAENAHIVSLVLQRQVVDNATGVGIDAETYFPVFLRMTSQSIQLIGGASSLDIRIPLTPQQIFVKIPVVRGMAIDTYYANNYSAAINFSYCVIFGIEYDI